MEKMLQASGSGLAHSARLINYDPENPDKLREFDNFDAAFAFDEECRLNGTGGRKAVHLPKPKDTVPKDQLALEKAMKHAVEEDKDTKIPIVNLSGTPACSDAQGSSRREKNRLTLILRQSIHGVFDPNVKVPEGRIRDAVLLTPAAKHAHLEHFSVTTKNVPQKTELPISAF